MSGIMLNFKGKMYKLCPASEMDKKPKSKPIEVSRKTRSDKGGTHTMPSGKEMTGKKHNKDSKPVDKKKTPPKKVVKTSTRKVKARPAPPKKSSPPKKAAPKKKAKKRMPMVEGFPTFKGDEPKAKEEKRRQNNLY